MQSLIIGIVRVFTFLYALQLVLSAMSWVMFDGSYGIRYGVYFLIEAMAIIGVWFSAPHLGKFAAPEQVNGLKNKIQIQSTAFIHVAAFLAFIHYMTEAAHVLTSHLVDETLLPITIWIKPVTGVFLSLIGFLFADVIAIRRPLEGRGCE